MRHHYPQMKLSTLRYLQYQRRTLIIQFSDCSVLNSVYNVPMFSILQNTRNVHKEHYVHKCSSMICNVIEQRKHYPMVQKHLCSQPKAHFRSQRHIFMFEDSSYPYSLHQTYILCNQQFPIINRPHVNIGTGQLYGCFEI